MYCLLDARRLEISSCKEVETKELEGVSSFLIEEVGFNWNPLRICSNKEELSEIGDFTFILVEGVFKVGEVGIAPVIVLVGACGIIELSIGLTKVDLVGFNCIPLRISDNNELIFVSETGDFTFKLVAGVFKIGGVRMVPFIVLVGAKGNSTVEAITVGV